MDEAAMAVALEEAEAAARAEPPDVPVGAVVVLDGQVIGRGRNMVEATGDPTMHAEVVAIRSALEVVGRQRLKDATLYVTMEPCIQCAGSIVLARVGRVVYGCDDPKAGAVASLYSVLTDPRLNHRCSVKRGVLAEECSRLLREFFQERRSEQE